MSQAINSELAALMAFMKGSFGPRIMQAGSRWMCWSHALNEWHIYDGRMPDGSGVLVWHTTDFAEALGKLNVAAHLPETQEIRR